jgi:hypothetical protein
MDFHAVTLVNMTDGSVQGHRTGCSDLSKKLKKMESCELEVASKAMARAEYNADFDEETDGWYEIEWLPCANHVPATIDDNIMGRVAAPVITTKVGAKWTYIYSDGELVAEIRNDQAAAIHAITASGR